jgi:hypothetical protein
MFAMPSRKEPRLILLTVERIISLRNKTLWEAGKLLTMLMLVFWVVTPCGLASR